VGLLAEGPDSLFILAGAAAVLKGRVFGMQRANATIGMQRANVLVAMGREA
jgi:hypothetical protein